MSNPPHFGRAFKEYNARGGKEGERALPVEREGPSRARFKRSLSIGKDGSSHSVSRWRCFVHFNIMIRFGDFGAGEFLCLAFACNHLRRGKFV